jgi:hypothetical protein
MNINQNTGTNLIAFSCFLCGINPSLVLQHYFILRIILKININGSNDEICSLKS